MHAGAPPTPTQVPAPAPAAAMVDVKIDKPASGGAAPASGGGGGGGARGPAFVVTRAAPLALFLNPLVNALAATRLLSSGLAHVTVYMHWSTFFPLQMSTFGVPIPFFFYFLYFTKSLYGMHLNGPLTILLLSAHPPRAVIDTPRARARLRAGVDPLAARLCGVAGRRPRLAAVALPLAPVRPATAQEPAR